MNRENYKRVLNKIESDPSCWYQGVWHCGTRHCFAGWAQILSGKEQCDQTVRFDAMEFLDVSYKESLYLFAPYRKLEDFHEFLRRDEMNVTEKR